MLVCGLVKFVPAVAYHLCLNLPEKFSQPRTKNFSQLCTCDEVDAILVLPTVSYHCYSLHLSGNRAFNFRLCRRAVSGYMGTAAWQCNRNALTISLRARQTQLTLCQPIPPVFCFGMGIALLLLIWRRESALSSTRS